MVYFTASCDDTATNRRFAETLELDYPILSDPSRETARAYGVVSGVGRYAARWTFYIGKDGRIRFIDKDVKAGSHGADVVARLAALRFPRRR